MIDWVIDVARRAEVAGALNAVAVATSVDASDDALASHVAALGTLHQPWCHMVARKTA
jgi:spore coat polysaccharide biosynthesis protein SpsF (cytidylyltransferase family)